MKRKTRRMKACKRTTMDSLPSKTSSQSCASNKANSRCSRSKLTGAKDKTTTLKSKTSQLKAERRS